MRRRALLATLAASTGSFAGCSGVLDDAEDTPNDPLYVDGIDVPEAFPASVTARIVSQPTEYDPGVWEVQFTNGDRHQLYRFSTPAPITAHVAEHVETDARLYFQDPDSVTGRVDGCWTGDANVRHAPPGTDDWDLEPGRELAFRNAVLAHPDNNDCILAGVYRVEERYEAYDEREQEWRAYDATFRLGVRE